MNIYLPPCPNQDTFEGLLALILISVTHPRPVELDTFSHLFPLWPMALEIVELFLAFTYPKCKARLLPVVQAV